jgi:hypothetical protein
MELGRIFYLYFLFVSKKGCPNMYIINYDFVPLPKKIIKRNNLFTTFYIVLESRTICEKIKKKISKI